MLIDTQIFIWWMEKSPRLSPKIISILKDRNEPIFFSLVSVWEIVIKKGVKKLKTPYDVEGGILASGFNLLPIELAHILEVEHLPSIHKDPFDRLLIAQAIVEKIKIITADPVFSKYPVALFKG